MLRENFDSLDAYEQAHARWDVRFQQIEAGKLRAGSLQVVGNSTMFTRASFNRRVHQQGASPPGMFTFGLIWGAQSNITWCGQQANLRTVECFESPGSFDTVTQGGFDVLTMSVATDKVLELEALHNLASPVSLVAPAASVFQPGDAAMRGIKWRFQQLLAATDETSQGYSRVEALRLMEEELPLALLGILESGSANATKPGSQMRHRAREQAVAYMREMGRDNISIAEICKHIDVSWRLLDYAFKDYYGVTPAAYKKMLRLDGLRSDLGKAEPDATVTVLASDWGFSHFGQLSVDYRKRFGESPSDTLKS